MHGRIVVVVHAIGAGVWIAIRGREIGVAMSASHGRRAGMHGRVHVGGVVGNSGRVRG